jgi:hypothetical protein
MKKEIIGSILAFVSGAFAVFGSFAALLLLLGLLWAIPTMLLWDWLMPELFELKEITLFQAWGINVLAGILFKNKSKTK